MKSLVFLVLALMLSACAAVTSPITTLFQRDVAAFGVMAERFGNEGEKRCAKFLAGALVGQDELLAADADGVLSASYKAMLLRRYIDANEQAFTQECGQFAAQIMVEIGRYLR